MIPLDFEYVAAGTVLEAVHEYKEWDRVGARPLYFGGGTEIITLARLHQLATGAVIDIKPISATRTLAVRGSQCVIGAAVSLTEIAESPAVRKEFPLLCATVREIADRTARNKITLGGNLCGQIFYREAVLPLLVCESKLRVAGPEGVREVPIGSVFRRSMQLDAGEFIVQTVTDEPPRTAPFVHVKRRKMGGVGYPIVTAAAIRMNHQIRVALSGVCPFPFRSPAVEAALNRQGLGAAQRIDQAMQAIPVKLVLHDFEASREYRLFVLETVFAEIMEQLER